MRKMIGSSSMKRIAMATLSTAVTGGVVMLSGCTMGAIQPSGAIAAAPSGGVKISGGVHGGQQPLIGSTLQLYAAGMPAMPSSGGSTGGYGQGAVALIPSGSMSVGSTNNYFPGGAGGCTFVAGNTNKCTVLPQTDASGSFVITGDYTCPSTASQIYMVATGGDPGVGSSNTYIAMAAGLGACPANGTLSPSLYIYINEVTTVATVWALQQFVGAPTGIAAGSYAGQGGATAGVAFNIGAPSGPAGGYGGSGVQTAVFGLQNGFSMINSLTNISTGSSGTGNAGTAANSWASPWAGKINAIADILAYCINSATNAGPCAQLMTDATPSGSTVAADTLQAATYMALNPTNNVSALFAHVGSTPPFATNISTAPTDWNVVVGFTTLTGGTNALLSPLWGAADEYGHMWVLNYNVAGGQSSVVEIGADGRLLAGPYGTPTSPYPISGGSTTACNTGTYTLANSSTGPKQLALDLTNTVWVTNTEGLCTGASTRSIMRITGSGADGTGATLANGIAFAGTPYSVSIDQNDTVYVPASSGKMSIYANAGSTPTSSVYTTLTGPQGSAVDNNPAGPFQWVLSSKVVCGSSTTSGIYYQAKVSAPGTLFGQYNNSLCTGGAFLAAPLSTSVEMAVDRNNNLWSVNNTSGSNSVTFVEVSQTDGSVGGSNGVTTGVGAAVSTVYANATTAGFAGMSAPYGVAVDGNNRAWVGNNSGTAVSVLGATYDGTNPISFTSYSGATGFVFPSSSLPFPHGVKGTTVDNSGNVWFFSANSTTAITYATVIVGAAGPVVTPVALQVKANMIGQKP